ncbi:hypothetical protein, partial [Novacetimonas hansenii]|uniref:hypothetical protein n=1 Tax=Novacetimonas hansenii TaxID=436 RepID=UPI001C3FAD29
FAYFLSMIWVQTVSKDLWRVKGNVFLNLFFQIFHVSLPEPVVSGLRQGLSGVRMTSSSPRAYRARV